MSSALPQLSEKPRFVSSMFGRIAGRYDLMNTLMSLGMDRSWRRVVAEEAVHRPGPLRLLDAGTGTAKLAMAVAERAGGGLMVGMDFTLPMLQVGKVWAREHARGAPVDLVAGDALRLPFPDASFDAVTSGFLVRNLADLSAGLREQARVLRPGGRLVVLETTPEAPWPFRPIFRLYFRGIVPLLGHLIAGDAAAYTYLPESTAAFVTPERIQQELQSLGLRRIHTRRLALGTVAVTSATKPETREECGLGAED